MFSKSRPTAPSPPAITRLPVIYFGTFLAFVFQTITGFALYSSMSNRFCRACLMDCSTDGRRIQCALLAPPVLWFFVTFVIIHIYLAFYHDYIEGRGTVSSIIGGWKFDREKPKK